jgi:uroporphyrinogen decarboxylase
LDIVVKVNKLSHRDRLERCLSGENTDRPPVALWRHFPVDDQTAEGLAAATAVFQRTFDFDFIKVTPASSYCIKDWGSQDTWRGNPEGTRDYDNEVITRFDDWNQLKNLNPQKGKLGEMVASLKLITAEFSPAVPVIQTIFSPLSQAKNLIGKDRLYYHMRACPEAVHIGLKKITDTTINFIYEARKTGIDGIFYAVQHAQYNLLTLTEFESFGRYYDLQILKAVSDLWLNVGHIHGENIMFDQVSDYPVAILNWHDRQTTPSLAEAQHRFAGVLCGGLRQWDTMVLGTPQSVTEESVDAIHQTNGKRFILGTGCVVPITAPYGNILAARQSVDNLKLT